MILRRTAAALLAPFVLAAAAEAQPQDPSRTAAQQLAEIEAEEDAEERALRFREEEGALDEGMLAAVDIGEGARIGVGRFTVPELAEPPSWTERQADPLDLTRPGHGIAAFGLRLPF